MSTKLSDRSFLYKDLLEELEIVKLVSSSYLSVDVVAFCLTNALFEMPSLKQAWLERKRKKPLGIQDQKTNRASHQKDI